MRAMTEEEFNAAQGQKKVLSEEEFNAAQGNSGEQPTSGFGGYLDSLKSHVKNALASSDTPTLSPQDVQSGINAIGAVSPEASMFGLKNSHPEIHQELAPGDKALEEGITGSSNAISKILSGFSTPKNLGIAASTAIPIVGPAIGFGTMALNAPAMVKGAYQGVKQGIGDIQSGDYEGAGENLTSGAINALPLAGLAGMIKEGVSPSEPYNKAATPELQEMAKNGAPLTAAEITRDPVVESVQGFLEKNPQAKRRFRAKGEEQEASIQNDINAFTDKIGTAPASQIAESVKAVTQPEGTYKKGINEMLADFQENQAARQEAYENNLSMAKENLKTLPQKESLTAGSDLESEVSKAHDDLNKAYQKQTAPILKKHLDKSASPEGLRQEIVSTLDRNGMIDEKGNILADEIDGVRNNDRKNFLKKLAGYSDDLKTNPNIRKLSQITQDLQAEANFGAKERSSYEQQFGPLSHAAKESLLDSLEKHVEPDQINQLRQARANYASTKPILDELSNATRNKWSEQIVKSAKSNLPNELLQSSIEKVPALKKSLGDVIMNNIVQSASNAEAFTKSIDSFGRNNLKSLLGDQKFKALTEAESNLSKASQPYEKAKAPKAIPQSLHGELSEHINQLAQENPNALSDHIIQENNPKRVQDYKKILGENFESIKKQFTQKLLGDHEAHVNGQSQGETTESGQFIPSKTQVTGKSLKDNLASYGDTLKEVYMPEELKKMNDIANKAEASQVAIRAKRPPMSPRGIKALISKIASGPIVSPLAKGWLSKTGTRLLSTTLPRSPAGVAPLANTLRTLNNKGEEQ